MGTLWEDDGHIIEDSGSLVECDDCPCGTGTGDDCTTYCASSSTPSAYDVTFPEFTAGNCGSTLCNQCSEQTFRCTQDEYAPCTYGHGSALPCSCGSSACPCFYLGVQIMSGLIRVTMYGTDSGDSGYNVVIWEASHTNGTTCMGTFTATHQSGGDAGKPCYCTGSCTVTAV